MKHLATHLAALALGGLAGFNVHSYLSAVPSAAYVCRFEFSPNDPDGFDAEVDRLALGLWNHVRQERGVWVVGELVAQVER